MLCKEFVITLTHSVKVKQANSEVSSRKIMQNQKIHRKNGEGGAAIDQNINGSLSLYGGTKAKFFSPLLRTADRQ